jgi:hypothetical protein|tara:strand:- start:1631 stop:2785 length:1155 start_codon:yes stop_codon:yes gene_type:complete
MMTERFVTLVDFKNWFTIDFLKQLRRILFCGNYGDAMTNPEFIEILSYFRELNPTADVVVITNGSGRNKKFWEDLSETINGYGSVVFSVDGLEDTNHIYRKGANWNKIMAAMKAYKSKGSRAIWEFLVFEHNQHQISEARQLAKEMGIDEFQAKKAIGFSSNSLASTERKGFIEVLNTDGTLDYKIFAPDDEWKNESIVRATDNVESVIATKIDAIEIDITHLYAQDSQGASIENLNRSINKEKITKLDKCDITCEAHSVFNGKDYSDIFVTSTGLVFPCCFIAGKYYATNTFETSQLREFVASYGENTIDLTVTNDLRSIIESDIMHHGYDDRWARLSLAEGRLVTCATYCGKDTNDEIASTLKIGRKQTKIRKKENPSRYVS